MNPLDDFLVTASQTSRPQQEQPAAAGPLDDFVNTARNPIGAVIDRSVRSGRDWEEARGSVLGSVQGVDEKAVERAYRSAFSQRKYSESNEDTARYIARRSLPGFSAGFSLMEGIKTARAKAKIEAGTATQEDYDEVAQRERLAQIDRERGVGGAALSALARVPAIVGEAVVGGGAVRGALGLGSAGTTGNLLARSAAQAGITAASTPLMPSTYLDQAVRRSEQQGGNWYDLKNLGVAGGQAVVQNALLGHSMKLAGGLPTRAVRGVAGAAIGTGEQQAADAAVSWLEEKYIPEAYQTRTRYGILGHLARGEKGEAMKAAATQAITFGFFSALAPSKGVPDATPRKEYDPTKQVVPQLRAASVEAYPMDEAAPREEGRRRTDPLEAFGRTLDAYGRLGHSPEYAAQEALKVGVLFKSFEKRERRPPTVAEAKALAKEAFPEGPTRDYANAIADSGAFVDAYAPAGTMPVVPMLQSAEGRRGLPFTQRLQGRPLPPDEGRPYTIITEGGRPEGDTANVPPRGGLPGPETAPEAPGRTIPPEAPEGQAAGEVAAEAKPEAPAATEPVPQAAIGDRAGWQKAVQEAREASKRGEEPVYVDMDIDNMAGLVKSRGSEAAVTHARDMVGIVRGELAKVGARVEVFRHAGDPQGDEHSAIVYGASKEQVNAALTAADTKIAKLNADMGLSDIPHAKEGRKGGVGITTSAETFREGKDAAAEAEAGVESRKGQAGRPRQQSQRIGMAGLTRQKPPEPTAKTLTDVQQKVLNERQAGKSFAEIGKGMGLTRQRVQQIEKEAQAALGESRSVEQGTNIPQRAAAAGILRKKAKGITEDLAAKADENELRDLENRYEEMGKKLDKSLAEGDDATTYRLLEDMAALTERGRAIQKANQADPGTTLFSNPIGPAIDFVKWLVRWLTDFRRNVGRLPLDFDTKNLLPRFTHQGTFTHIFSTPEGMGRFPILARIFDPRGTERSPEGQSILGRQAAVEIGKNIAALWSQANSSAKTIFQFDPDGSMHLTGNQKGRLSDVMEAELRRPGSQPITSEQRDWLNNTYKPLLKDFQQMLRDEGVAHFIDPQGNSIEFSDHYFPRPAIGKKGHPSPSGPGQPPRGPSQPGTKGFWQKSRDFATEKEGAANGMIYDPDPVSRIAKMIAGGYRAVADHRLANDPALQGKNKSVWLETRPALVASPAFKGKVYPLETAKKIEAYYAKENPGLAGRTIATINDFSKALSLGFDASVLFNQMLTPLFMGTYRGMPIGQKAWVKGTLNFLKSAFSESAMTRYLNKPENAQAARELAQGGSSVSRLTDFLAGMETGSPAEKLPVVGAGVRWSGRTFGAAVDTVKIELWKAMRDTTPPDQRVAVMQRIDSIIGSGRMEQTGLTPSRALVERLLFLAPSLYRAGLDNVAGAAQRGVSGQLARRAVMGQAFGTALAAYAGMRIAGLSEDEMVERFDPRSGKFLTVPITLSDGSKVNVRFGNILTSYVRLMGDLVETQTDDSKGARGPVDVLLRWYRQHSSPAIRTGADFILEKDVLGRPQSRTETLGKAVTPLSGQDILYDEHGVAGSKGFQDQAAVRAGLSALGIQAFPESEKKRR